MRKQVTTFMISVEHDNVPGVMYTAESVKQCVEVGINSRVSSYNPVVKPIHTAVFENSEEAQKEVWNALNSLPLEL